ncbi:hypothetical protein SAMD00019534_019890, partial [Acytostelium subglobosum LB1]|uniref:hypothetical protein n=1 Tax=Acytostelium subglobosum LB1 TaxID=1410327 RepID=UPI000644FAF5
MMLSYKLPMFCTLVLLTSLLLMIIEHEQYYVNAVKLEFNGNYYEFNPTNVQYKDALKACEQSSYKEKKGYMVTITSKKENDWIIQQYKLRSDMQDTRFWISGQSTKSEPGVFYYTSGPENGQPLYNVYTDECGIFCSWNIYEPNINSNETSIVMSTNLININHLALWDNCDPTTSLGYLCEYGGLEDPFIPPVRTVGGDVVINNIVNMTLVPRATSSSDYTITFVGEDKGKMFSGTNIKILSNTSLSTTIPPGSGTFNVSITSLFLTNTSVPCANINWLAPGAITCQVTKDLSNEVLVPITIATDSVYTITNKPPFYDMEMNSVYTCFRTFTDVYQYAHSQSVQGMNGILSFVGTKSVKNNTASMCPGGTVDWYGNSVHWIDAYYSVALKDVSGHLLIDDGPMKDTQPYIDVSIPLPTASPGVPYYYSPRYSGYKRAIPPSPYIGVFTELLMNTTMTNITAPIDDMPTEGMTKNVPYGRRGQPFDTLTVTYQGVQYSILRDFYSATLALPIPPGYGQSHALQIIHKQFGLGPVIVTNYNVNYGAPFITSILPPVGVNGGLVTVSGFNFYSNSSLVSVSIGQSKCLNVKFLEAHMSVTCQLPSPMVGNLHLGQASTLSVGGIVSIPFSTQIMAPVIEWATPGRLNQTTLITIVGNYFSPWNLTVAISGVPCYAPANLKTAFINETMLQCMFDGTVPIPAGSIESLPVNVTTQTLTNTKQVFYYINETQTNCSDHGVSVGGKCVCRAGWIGEQCSVNTIPAQTPVIDGGTVISPSDTLSFNTSIVYMREIDNMDATVKTLVMSSIKWTNSTNANDDGTQLIGQFAGENITVGLHIQYFKDDTIVHFTGEDIHIAANSVKFTVSIAKWPFSNNVNTLQLVIASQTAKEKNPCIQTTARNGVNSYYIESGRSVLYASFASHLYVDGRVVKSTLEDISANDTLYTSLPQNSMSDFVYLTSVRVPHFDKECIVDPSFQSLVKVEKDTPCGSSSGNGNTKVIIIVVVCSIIGAGIILAGILLFKKYKYQLMRMHRSKNVINMKTRE